MSDEQKQDANEQSELDDIWGDAMAEQANASPEEQGDAADTDTFEDAPDDADTDDEVAAKPESPKESTEPPAQSADVFKPLGNALGLSNEKPRELEMVMEIPVTLSVELGRTRLSIRELLDLAKGSIVELEGLAGEPMDIMVNGYLIAQGEVVVIEDSYGIRVTDIITPAERLQRLNKR